MISYSSVEVEQSVLGAILLDGNEILTATREILDAEDFYIDVHRKIYLAMIDLAKADKPVDLTLTAEKLKEKKELSKIGGPLYLTELMSKTPISANVVYHARIVKDYSIKRQIVIKTIQWKQKLAEVGDSEMILREMQKELDVFRMSKSGNEYVALKDILEETLRELELLHETGGVSGIPTGFIDIDRHIGGLHGGELIIVAGRPGHGKSVFAKDLMLNCGVPSLLFSLEMSSTEYGKRQLSDLGRVDFKLLRLGLIGSDDWERIAKVCTEIAERNIFVIDEPYLDIYRIEAITSRAKSRENIGLVVIDYLQLVKTDRGRSREEEVAGVSKHLKNLARTLDIPVVCICQLNRQCETRNDKRPQLSDLRESGAIEQDADIVAALYRPEQYFEDVNIDMLFKGCSSKPASIDGYAEFNILKGRNVRVGTIPLTFQGQFQRFANYSKEQINVPF